MAKELVASNERSALVQSGLTRGQAAIYDVLVHNRSLPASQVSRLAGMPRTLGYKFLSELVSLGLIVRNEKVGEVARFSAAHPFKLKEFADKQFEAAKDAKVALEGTLAKLISDFNTATGQPGVRILEGATGLAEMYEDILNERQSVLLIRSPFDREQPALAEIIAEHIAQKAKLGIHTRAITPLVEGTPRRILTPDKANLVERRIVPEGRFMIPAQITIYGNKVALTAYEKAIITTVIENMAISATFKILFDYLWEMSLPDHQKILATITP